jgi:hypothetical protein
MSHLLKIGVDIQPFTLAVSSVFIAIRKVTLSDREYSCGTAWSVSGRYSGIVSFPPPSLSFSLSLSLYLSLSLSLSLFLVDIVLRFQSLIYYVVNTTSGKQIKCISMLTSNPT